MRAVCWYGRHDVRLRAVPDPAPCNPRDAVLRVLACAIGADDLRAYTQPPAGVQRGDILGTSFVGQVVEIGAAVQNVRRGDRVLVPAAVACGQCRCCRAMAFALCENSHPAASPPRRASG